MARKRGGNLNKSEAVQVRFDPILKMAAELAALHERRTLSSYTEIAVEQAAKQSIVGRDEAGNPVSAWQVAQECWHSEPIRRLNALANSYPEVLTLQERKIIAAKKWLSGSEFHKDGDKLIETVLTEDGWDELCQYADGEIDLNELAARLREIEPA
jgi:hypothetical protein